MHSQQLSWVRELLYQPGHCQLYVNNITFVYLLYTAMCSRVSNDHFVCLLTVATNVGMIVGAAVGCVVGLILLLLICFVFFVRRRRDGEDDMANEIK